MDILDYYAVLGLPKFTSDQETIKKAYICQIKFFHPDAKPGLHSGRPGNFIWDQSRITRSLG